MVRWRRSHKEGGGSDWTTQDLSLGCRGFLGRARVVFPVEKRQVM